MIEIREATKNQAPEITSLIMMAMTDDCCLYFCGDGYGLEDLTSGRACSRSAEQASLLRSRMLADFRKMMMMLVEREDSQYSYKNTLVALDGENVVGISVSYDGGKLHQLRHAFIESAKEYIGKDHSGMDDETQAGELYLDLLLSAKTFYYQRNIFQSLITCDCEFSFSKVSPSSLIIL